MGHSQLIPALGLAVILAAGNSAAQSPTGALDLVEVRDPQGQAVLRGQFDVRDDERYAALGPAGQDDLGAAGDVEMDPSGIEVAVRNLDPRTQYTIAIDGVEVGTITTDGKGRGSLELDPDGLARLPEMPPLVRRHDSEP
jgi:hypothetical protein